MTVKLVPLQYPRQHSIAFRDPEQFTAGVIEEARAIIGEYSAVGGASGGGTAQLLFI